MNAGTIIPHASVDTEGMIVDFRDFFQPQRQLSKQEVFMLYTDIPTQQEIHDAKFNVGKTPEQIIFPTEEDKLRYVQQCAALVAETPINLLTQENDVKVMTFGSHSIAIRSFHLEMPTREDDLVLAPHCDDEVIACGGYAVVARRSGRRLRTLIFTVGSGGRMDHGFDEDESRTARLAESIRGAMGLFSTIDVIMVDGKFGFSEWLWGRDGLPFELGIRLARLYNPARILAPHQNPEVDTHPDHTAVGLVAKAMTAHGQWTDYHPSYITDRRINASEGVRNPELWQYRVWSGNLNWQPNRNIRYELADFADISQRIGQHRTQTVPIDPFLGIDNSYAAGKICRELSDRWWMDVNNPEVFAIESYLVSTSTTTVTSL